MILAKTCHVSNMMQNFKKATYRPVAKKTKAV